MKEQIETKSLRERILLRNLLDTQPNLTQIVYTPYDGQDKFDATWIQWHHEHLAAMRVIAEVKVRNYPITSYDGWLIEKDKYDYLMAQPFEKKLYINFHPDGIQVWDLAKVPEPIWKETILPKNNQSDDDKMKINGDLMKTDSEKIIKEIKIYEALDKANHIWKKRQK
jgi:hypothetical protein